MNYQLEIGGTFFVWVDISPYLPDDGSRQEEQDFAFVENLVQYPRSIRYSLDGF
jgi:hypothetical protein